MFRNVSVLTASALVAMTQTAGQAAAQETIYLEPIIVEGDVADTSSSLILPEMRSAAKTDTPVVETPQALTVLTRKQFDDQNTQTVGQALRYTAGVLSEVDASTRYDSVFLRGFGGFGTASSFVSFFDGLRQPRGQAFAQPAIDPFLLDRVDVLKGPSALVYGQTSPGGLVNMVSRAPDGSSGGEARLELGSHNRVQLGAEQHGVLNAAGTLQYSISGMLREAGSRYDGVDEARYSFAPKLVWTPTERTRVTIGAHYQADPEGGYFNSVYPASLAPALAPYLSSELNIGDPTFETFDRKQWGIFAGIEHGFSSSLTLRSKLRYSSVDVDLQAVQMMGPVSAAGVVPRVALQSFEDLSGFAWDTNLEYETQTGAVSHRILVGADLSRNDTDWQYSFAGAPSLDVTNPTYGGITGPFFPAIDNRQITRQKGLYLSDQISVGNFRAVLGARRDWIETENINRLAATSTVQDSNNTSYRAAVLYGFDNGVAPYASYATSFQPEIGVDENGNSFVPTVSKQYEIGVKYQPSHLNTLFTLAAFDLTQENVKTPGATANTFIQTGEIRSRGLEFEARGQLTSQLELIAAMTLLDTEVSSSTTSSIIGNRPQAVPEHFGSIWANYTFDGALSGLTLGGGLRVVGSSYGDDANTLKASGYTLVDLALSYDFGHRGDLLSGVKARLNVRNLFDETYYSSCSYDYFCQYGEGRVITAGLQKTW
ncbi:TonB-dependent siderophore receptor [Phaeobacter sp. B1627]|uniref:TonB-dependent siderophore receptor n=1 Tax=Phaeobacter sp. B1627 TaxID=2583809 RepID=UPI00111B6005|nr:TonB-dependent siderophore receptor [Phaeobacter sp. B1627]TNJ43298.1 TonB-dependent siderophore receptor [Phaeobacter sp. B1627]